MKKNIVLGLTMSVMLLGMIVVATPAFAVGQHHKFDPSTIPAQGTEYVLTISGEAELAGYAGSFTKHAPNKMRAVGSTVVPTELIGPTRSGFGVIEQASKPEPVSGEVVIKVADFYVRTPQSSSNSPRLSLLVNPNAMVFVVEGGHITLGDTTYAIDGGAAIYYKKFSLTLGSGTDFALSVKAPLQGGIPGTETPRLGLLSFHNNWWPVTEESFIVSEQPNLAISMLKVDGDSWIFKGTIKMSE